MLDSLTKQAAVEMAAFEWFASSLTTQQKHTLLIEPFQRELLTPTFAGVQVNVVCLPKKNGKAESLDTPTPTPYGWKTHGDLHPGDEVFDEQGQVRKVIAESPVWTDRPCYEISFSDGTSIVADAEHEWVVFDVHKQRYVTLTTAQIAQQPRRNAQSRGDSAALYSIDVAKPLQLPNIDLPIDPYVLGAWLGDGDTSDGGFTSADPEIIREIEGHYPVSKRKAKYRYGILGLRVDLRKAGVFKNKHIPAEYLRASYEQRLALLQGLMDTDGYAPNGKGQLEYTTTCKPLADGVIELIRSLGLKPRMIEAEATFEGRNCGPKWRITFVAFDSQPVFCLQRKFARQKPDPCKLSRSQTRQIVSVDPVASVPVKCIQVEGGIYLTGAGMVPTHNSTIIAAVALYHLMTVHLAEVIVIASSKEQAAILYKHCAKFVASSPQLKEAFVIRAGSKEIRRRDNDLTRIRVLTNDPNTLEGVEPTLGIVDEYHTYTSDEAYGIIRDGIDTRNGQMLVITNAGQDEESPFGQLRGSALELPHKERRGAYTFCLNKAETFAYHEYALDPDADVEDLALVKTANPASWITEEILLERKNDPGETVQRFKRFACGLWVRSEETAILPTEWDALCDTNSFIPDGESIWIGWDHATRGPDKAALVPLWWKNNDERVFGDPIILSAPDNGGMISDLDVTNALLEFEKTWTIEAIVYDPNAGAAMLATMLEREHGWMFAEHSQKSATLAPADVRFLEAVREKKIIHNGNKEFRQHVLNAVERTVSTSGEWIFGRPKHGARVPMDALRAASLCHAVALKENEYNGPGIKPVFM